MVKPPAEAAGGIGCWPRCVVPGRGRQPIPAVNGRSAFGESLSSTYFLAKTRLSIKTWSSSSVIGPLMARAGNVSDGVCSK